jgi:hypothetical protein
LSPIKSGMESACIARIHDIKLKRIGTTSLCFSTSISIRPYNAFSSHCHECYTRSGVRLFGRQSKSTDSNELQRGKRISGAKEHLPIKICVVCQRPFTWRKKWERCWDEVTCCSKRCKSLRKQSNKGSLSR